MEFLDNLMASNEESRMMQLPVRFTAEKSCWVSLPPSLVARLLDAQLPWPLILELRPHVPPGAARSAPIPRPLHVACVGGASRGDVLEVPAGLAMALGLTEGGRVGVRAVPDVPEAVSVSVEPASADDWELVEMNADHMEETLLNQVGVASVGQPFPFWVRGQSALRLAVASAEPASLVRLVRGSEVAVAPRPRARPTGPSADGTVVNHGTGATSPDQAMPPSVHATWWRLQEPNLEMLHGLPGGDVATGLRTWPSTSAFMSMEAAEEVGLHGGDLITVSRTLSSREPRLTLRLVLSDRVGPAHVLLSPPALRAISATPHRRVALLPAGPRAHCTVELKAVQSIVLHPVPAAGVHRAPQSPEAAAAFKDQFAGWVSAQEACVQTRQSNGASTPEEGLLGDGIPIQGGTLVQFVSPQGQGNEQFFVEIRWTGGAARSGNVIMLTAADVAEGRVSSELGNPTELPAADVGPVRPANALTAPSAFGRKWHLDYALPALKRLLPLLHHTCRKQLRRMGGAAPGGLLLCGPPGSGKKELIRVLDGVLSSNLSCQTHMVHIQGQDYDLDRPAKTQQKLVPLLQEAMERMPSLVVIHDLHLLCPAEGDSPDAQPSPGAVALSHWLRGVMAALHARRDGAPPMPVVFCGTCTEAAAVSAVLRGPGALDHVVTLPSPGTEERGGLLRVALESRNASYLPEDLKAMALRADGYDADDLKVLVERALHAALKRRLAQGLSTNGPLRVEMRDLEAAQDGFQPSASWGVGTAAPSGSGPRGWQDVGGAQAAREALQEALELPSRMAKLIAKAPLRLRTGVLLFGPPGCGKTHIVAAAVASAGLRFVSVKGPEVLNKYIGASEAAVRDLFRRAAAAAPCVLFFDEFDAIAPQRGHDSTGVTDRVVNQLLTELDGVEGLRGVIVLAATSRPDLLDAALLRPGRLDRLVYCGVPDGGERAHILRALAGRLPLAPDVDLDAVAAHADGFTGADLGALLSEAQLSAVHAVLDAPPPPDGVEAAPLISQRHLEAAMASSRPSVPPAERARLEAIYSKFQQARDPGIGNAAASGKGKGKRATLA